MPPRLLTRAEVAQLLGVSVRSVDRLRKRQLLPAVKVFASVRFREEDVRRFITSQRGAND
jgi:excisionase family DNA binding protein